MIDHDDGDREDDDRHDEGSGKLVEAEEVSGDPATAGATVGPSTEPIDPAQTTTPIFGPVRLLGEIGGGAAAARFAAWPVPMPSTPISRRIDLGDHCEEGEKAPSAPMTHARRRPGRRPCSAVATSGTAVIAPPIEIIDAEGREVSLPVMSSATRLVAAKPPTPMPRATPS